LPAGSNSITFAYSGDAQYKAAQTTVTQFVNKAGTTTTAAINGNSQPLHLTAAVSIAPASAAPMAFSLPGNLSSSDPSGSVQFYNGTTLLGTATLAPSGLFTSTATLAVAAVPASLTAVYVGDTNYNGSTSATVTGVGGATVGVSVSSSVNPSTFAQPVTFTIQVAPVAVSNGYQYPTGTVTASLMGLYNLGSAALSGGRASITVPSAPTTSASVPWGLPTGPDSITFSYNGDGNYAPAQTNFTQTVDKAATFTTAVLSATDTSITATVGINDPSASSIAFAIPGPNAATANPTGNVQFLNGSTVIGTATLSPSGRFQATATYTVTQPFGTSAALTASYDGDANYIRSASGLATIPNLPAVTVGVQSSVNPASFAQPVTLSISVAPAATSSQIPSGTLQASVLGSDTLGSATLDSNGKASIAIPPQIPSAASPGLPWGLATGSNTITVTYSGDSNFAAGQTTFTQLVTQSHTTTHLLFAPGPSTSNSETVAVNVSIDEPSVSQTAFAIPAPGNLSTSPSGDVDFFDGTTLLGTVKLNSTGLFESSATFTASPVPTSIGAVYYGDVNYYASGSQSSTGTGTATVTLTSSSNPTVYGASVTLQATVTAAATGGVPPTGTVQFFDGTQNLGWTATVDSSGHATLPFPIPLATPQVCLVTCPPASDVLVLGVGANVLSAQYSGDANYAPATSAAITQQVTKASTTTSVSGFSAAAGLPFENGITATVADAQVPSLGPYHFMAMTASGQVEGDPTGIVTFYSGSTAAANVTLTPNISGNVSSTASLNSSSTNVSNDSAVYSGDANFLASSSPTTAATGVTLTGNPNPGIAGQSVILTATVTSATATPAITGKVSFLQGSAVIGSSTVSNGTASISAAFTASGSLSLTAVYSGDTNYSPSTSPVYTEVINPSTNPTDSLTLSASTVTAVYGQRLVLLAQVSGSIGTPPTGTVTFLDGTTVIGTDTLQADSAYLLVTLAVGTHQISARWPGDSNWPAAQSNVVAITVNRAGTHTALSNFGDVWTAAVQPVLPGEGTPTGSVQFIDSVTQAVLAAVTLNAGFATATLNSVSDPVDAQYSGDTNFAPSASHVSSSVIHTRR
jgi:hypothetical protein